MILSGFYNYIMGSYDAEREYVTAKKAQFLFWFFIIYGIMMSLVPVVFVFTAGHERAVQGLIVSYPQLPLLVVALLMIRTRKIRTAANIMGWIAFLLSIAGYYTRPVPISGVSMAYFQFAAVVFSIFFCSYSLAVFFFAGFIIADSLYFVFLVRPVLATLDPLLQTAAYSQLFDIPIALTIVFICGLSATKIVNKALQIMQQQTAENLKQSQANENLVSTIRDVAGKLSASIERTSSVITSFSDNARTQAASVEELSATIDEISAGTESAQQATIDQNSSVTI
jgi:hypothetical protein